MRIRIALALIALPALLAGCSGDDGDTTTTGGAASGSTVTSLAGTSGTTGTTPTGSGATSTTIDLGEPVIPEWTVVSRTDGNEGSTLVVLLDPESYDSLTDIDLQNVVAGVVESEDEPVLEAHVVDDPEVADYVLAENPNPRQTRQLDIHYLARLEDGFRIVFLGPFSDTGSVVLGS